MTAYYNEFDPKAAAWLRELIKAGEIANGIVDERSIEDVTPADLAGFTQCHFFAGIGGWGLALRLAGIPDDTPLWTGSCPCQPFSSAGKGGGFADERHLWPHWQWLIQQCRPPVIFGEQVASKAVEPWIDLVHADMEAMGYAFGCIPFPSASVGAPHIRDRAYWVAHADSAGREQGQRNNSTSRYRPSVAADREPFRLADADDAGPQGRGQPGRERAAERPVGAGSVAGGLGHTAHESRERIAGGVSGEEAPQHGARVTVDGGVPERSEYAGSGVGGLADAASQRRQRGGTPDHRRGDPGAGAWSNGLDGGCASERTAGPTNGFWGAADWIFCRDGKWRPVEPGTFPLAHGVPARVGRLRGYGNAINPFQAAEFIRAALITKEAL